MLTELVLILLVFGFGWIYLKEKNRPDEPNEPIEAPKPKAPRAIHRINYNGYLVFKHIATHSDLRKGNTAIGKTPNISYEDGYDDVYFQQFNGNKIIDGSFLNLSKILGNNEGVLDGSTVRFFTKIVEIINRGGKILPIWTEREHRCIVSEKDGLPIGEFTFSDKEITFLDWSNE